MIKVECFFFNLNPVWEFYWLLVFVNFITLITLRWFGQFITSRQLFLAIQLIAFLYISNLKCMRTQLRNPQTGFKLKKNTIDLETGIVFTHRIKAKHKREAKYEIEAQNEIEA